MYLIVGLGNPGQKYIDTRHNIGFMFLDYLASEEKVNFKDSKWEADVAKTNLWSKQVLLVKPQTYMNLSGKSVGLIASYYQIEPEHIIVVHDDLDLDAGRIKIVFDRGHGGHNGIRSIIESLGTREFARLRIGIGRPPEKMQPSSFVLSRFTSEELILIREGFTEMEKSIRMVAEEGVIKAMNHTNIKNSDKSIT